MPTSYKDKYGFLRVFAVASFFLSCVIILNFAKLDPDFKLLIISIACVTILTALEARYFIFYTIIFAYFAFITDYNIAMSPVDSQKFYAEAFYGGYFDKEHISTVIAVGWMYKLIAFLVNDTSPQVIVFINFFLHCYSIILLAKTIKIITKRNASLVFLMFGFFSPILLTQLPYLIKDYFSAFFAVLAFYLYVKYYKTEDKYVMLLSIIAMIASMAFRVYSPVYVLILVMCTGVGRKYYLMCISLLMVGLVVTFGLVAIYYFLFSVLALLFIPNFLEVNNYIEHPFVTIESLIITSILLFTFCKLLVKRKYKELKIFFYIICLVGITYAFTSLYRITFTSYEMDGASYLADNFFRKKLPIMYIIIFLLFGGNLSLIKEKIATRFLKDANG